VLLAGLLGVGSTDNVGAVLDSLLGVERTLLAGEALEENLGPVEGATEEYAERVRPEERTARVKG
jgi:hypothetical protein